VAWDGAGEDGRRVAHLRAFVHVVERFLRSGLHPEKQFAHAHAFQTTA
jgi:hypothetical protein